MPRAGGCAAALVLAALALTASGCATTSTGPLEPLVVGWERFFKLEWQPGARDGRPVVWGYILNDWGMPAASVRILVDGLGPGGELLEQRLAWVGSLTPGMRAYFEVPVERPAAAYRVRVFSFDWVLEDDLGIRRRRFP